MDAAANYIYDYPFLEWSEPGDASRLEGYLFPDTYEFYQGEQASSAINKFLLNFHGKLTGGHVHAGGQPGHLAASGGHRGLYDRGRGRKQRRARQHRLRHLQPPRPGMPLQIDATVMYALGEHKEHLTEEDLKVESPLTPTRTPVCPPDPYRTRASRPLNAALNPASTSYLYYALDTETGTHRFFTNYNDFEAFTATQDYTRD